MRCETLFRSQEKGGGCKDLRTVPGIIPVQIGQKIIHHRHGCQEFFLVTELPELFVYEDGGATQVVRVKPAD